jgi:uncharacterized protein
VRNINTAYIVKLADICNLACRYCYYFKHRRDVKVPLMSVSLLESLINQAARLSPAVMFIWHGGEPLMAGKDLFQAIIDIESHRFQRDGTIFQNSIQTNGTLLDEEWCAFFREHQFDVGVSLDGPEDIHNDYRVYPNGEGSFSDVIRGLELLTQTETLSSGVLAVVSHSSLGRAEEIFRFFLDEGVHRFNLLPCIELDSRTKRLTPQSIRPAEYAQFMCEIYNLLIQKNDPTIKITDLFNTLVALLGGRPTICKLNGECGEYVTIQPDGTVWPCDNFVGTEGFHLGNLREQSLTEILGGEPRKRFHRWVASQRVACSNCEWNSVCKGGCSWRHYQRSRLELPPGSHWCEANKAIFSYIEKHLVDVVPEYERPQKD